MSHRTSRHRRTGLIVATLALVLTAGCGSGGSGGSAEQSTDEPVVTAAAGVADECRVFPFAMPDPDLGDLSLLPADFPEPPVPATLCETGGTGGEQEYASYATTASSEEILAGYEAALDGATRAADGAGSPIVTTTVGDVVVQVNIKDGGYSLVFARG